MEGVSMGSSVTLPDVSILNNFFPGVSLSLVTWMGVLGIDSQELHVGASGAEACSLILRKYVNIKRNQTSYAFEVSITFAFYFGRLQKGIEPESYLVRDAAAELQASQRREEHTKPHCKHANSKIQPRSVIRKKKEQRSVYGLICSLRREFRFVLKDKIFVFKVAQGSSEW